eukprot:TRINITY_DN49319_c0_g1_i1.p4 TRINITY_DN49319_c0_g1~~TRINITY_DN49319_c0_g1_i1.p4  ORF type:complete len:113 (-),score=6.83 TRINITY_DN49319_c0_g1_i1:242-580(-)
MLVGLNLLWFGLLPDIAHHCGLASMPARDVLVCALRDAGFAASPSHVETRAVKTSATMQQIKQVCLALRCDSGVKEGRQSLQQSLLLQQSAQKNFVNALVMPFFLCNATAKI